METKICNKCGKELPIDQFEIEHCKQGDYIRKTCRNCRSIYRKLRRKSHPKIYIDQVTRRVKRIREWQNSLKTPCIICGEKEPVCIDWHHINPNNKLFTIGKHLSFSRLRILEEIKKCVCLCSNCHRKVHADIINLYDYIDNESSPCQTGESVTE